MPAIHNANSLRLNADLVMRRMHGRFATVPDLANRLGVNRTTLYRWLDPSGQWSPAAKNFLKLAAALDVDPMGLWDLSVETYLRLHPKFIRFARVRDWSYLLSALSYVESFILPQQAWPPMKIAQGYDKARKWEFEDITHRPPQDRFNYYGSLIITPSRLDVQVWHFAFREMGKYLKATSWFPYGFVRLLDSEVCLFNYIGKAERAEFATGPADFVVQTHFGEEAMDFRIASLHPFGIKKAESTPGGLPVVRFWHPRPQ